MKVVPLNEVKDKLSVFVKLAQTEKVLVTIFGKPAAILSGVEGRALEDVLFENDPEEVRIMRERLAAAGGRPIEEYAAERGIPLARPKRHALRAPAKRAAKTARKR